MFAIDNVPSRYNWEDIRYFLEVSRAASLLEAGAKLGVSHTTVARRIKSLEQDLGAELFEKKPSGYELTDIGTHLLNHAQAIETKCFTLQEAVADEGTKLHGIVRLSVPEGFGCHFLPRHLGEFTEQHPHIDLEILAHSFSLSVFKREAHISITRERPTIGRLIAPVLTDYVLRFYATPAYLASRPKVDNLEELSQLDLIATRHAADSPDARFADTIFPIGDARLRFSSINAQLAAVEAGLGTSLIPCYMADSRGILCKVIPDQVKVVRTYWICMHEDMRNVPRVRAVWEWLKKLVERERKVMLDI